MQTNKKEKHILGIILGVGLLGIIGIGAFIFLGMPQSNPEEVRRSVQELDELGVNLTSELLATSTTMAEANYESSRTHLDNADNIVNRMDDVARRGRQYATQEQIPYFDTLIARNGHSRNFILATRDLISYFERGDQEGAAQALTRMSNYTGYITTYEERLYDLRGRLF